MSVSIQKQRGAVTFKADKGLNPEALQKVPPHGGHLHEDEQLPTHHHHGRVLAYISLSLHYFL
jgi:hypothetical protein